MKIVRLWFKKENQARFISHLDLNRVMIRALNMAQIPLIYTQGFNPHPSVTFALPLSVGMRTDKSCMDIKLEDTVSIANIQEKVNLYLPTGLEIFSVKKPIMKAKEIAFADFRIQVSDTTVKSLNLKKMAEKLFSKENISVKKKTKSGIKSTDIKPYIKKISFTADEKSNILNINVTLNAGSQINVNPVLLISSLNKEYALDLFYDITRHKMYDQNLNEFE